MKKFSSRVALVSAVVVLAIPASAAARVSESLQSTYLTLTGPTTVLATGTKITLSGYLTNRTAGRRVSNGIVTIYYASPGASSWTRLNAVLTNYSGYYTDTVTVHSTVSFYASFSQVGRFGGTQTGTLKVSVPAVANTALEWGSDGCLYEGVSGSWQGQWCVRRAANTAGQALQNQYWVYAFNPSIVSHLGAAQFIWDPALSSSNYYVVRGAPGQPADVVWMALPLNSSVQFLVDSEVNGQYVWLTAAEYVADKQANEIGSSTPAVSSNSVTIGGGIPAGFQSLANGTGANAVLGNLEAQSGGGNPLLNELIYDTGFDTELDALDGDY